jgi:hypothetical protein
MTIPYFYRLVIILSLFVSLSAIASAADNEEITLTATTFVERVCAKDTDAVFQSFTFIDEFRAAMPDADTVTDWSNKIDRTFGQLGNVVHSEIVEHDQTMRSVFLYYHGSKHPAKIWVTFSRNNASEGIGGFHYNIWADGYDAEQYEFYRTWNALFLPLFIAYSLVASLLCIFLGERIRNKSVRRLQENYRYQNEHLLLYYVEKQVPAWLYVLALAMIVWVIALLINLHHIINPFLDGFIPAIVCAIVGCTFLSLAITGFWITVDEQFVRVRLGTFRIPVLRIKLQDIQAVETVKFRPIRDFGGWGIRCGKDGTWAYFMSGDSGVKITTDAGIKYILGSDIPERLAEVIRRKADMQ